jgi:alanine dehydrogenase
MNFGIARENPINERRVALTPAGVQALIDAGQTVYVQSGAGDSARFNDEDYIDVGAKIVYTPEEVYGRSDVLLKVSPLTGSDALMLREESAVLSFLHLPVASRRVIEIVLERRTAMIGYELIETDSKNLPILHVMSEIAGQLSITIGARYLETGQNGRGILLGGIAGVPPAAVVILGAGVVGETAARTAIGMGAQVVVLDRDLARLRHVDELLDHRVTTALTNTYNIRRGLQYADVLIGAVLIKGERTPHLVTEDMVKAMKPGAVVVDVSIDQGGCVATSHPTTLESPVFVKHGVIHYCVPNIPATVARTATNGITNALLPYLLEFAEHGIEGAIRGNPDIARGVCTYGGACTLEKAAQLLNVPYRPLADLL